MPVPVIDIFAGPGGLGEGFSSILDEKGERIFEIKLSVEKDMFAHKTLELRSFFRQFPVNEAPDEYYQLLHEPDLEEREKKRAVLFTKYKSERCKAGEEAWKAELGHKDFPPELVDHRIEKALNGEDNWVLIGGPPCQAYSVAGRSRIGGVHVDDHRVYLYREYLRIIAKHHPAVFVMENVKGLLSAKLNGEKIFHWMLNDLSNPSSVLKEYKSPEYRIYSLVKKDVKKDSNYLIRAEDYGIPQKRHRLILLGVREDINVRPETLRVQIEKISLSSVIGKLPDIRSALNREYLRTETENGIKKRVYGVVKDSDMEWKKLITSFRKDIISWNGFATDFLKEEDYLPKYGTGSEYIECGDTIDEKHFLYKWYIDPKLKGVINHQSRSHLVQDLKRYLFACIYTKNHNQFPKLTDYEKHDEELLPDHKNARSGKFTDRFRVQLPDEPATTVTSHLAKDGHYFIHYDVKQCRSLTVREAARIQTFPDNYLFCGSRTQQYQQVGNAVPPYLAKQIGEIVHNIFSLTKAVSTLKSKNLFLVNVEG